MIDVGATFAVSAFVQAVLAGIAGNQANMAVVAGGRSARHAVQCFLNNLKRLDAKENQVLYRAMLTAHWQAIQQTAVTYARINHIEVHGNFDLWPAPLRRALESFHLRGESVSLHPRGGIVTLRSETAGNALKALIGECDRRISNLRNGFPHVPSKWAVALDPMFEDLTALVAQNQDPARGPAETTWKPLEAEFPDAAACDGFHQFFVSCWYDCLCVNFQILTQAPDVSPLLTGKLFAEIRDRPEAPPFEPLTFVAALRDSIQTLLDGVEQRIITEVRESEKRTADTVQKLGTQIITQLKTLGDDLRADRQTHHVEIADRRIGLGNINASVLGRDREAELLMLELDKPGPASISITAPPGFGKSALFHLAVRKTLDRNPPYGGLRGIALLNAQVKEESPGIPYLAQCLGRMTGLDQEAAAFAGSSAGNLADRRRFFDFLHRIGKVWFVIDNAEALLGTSADSAELLSLLNCWCDADHEAKLLILTRRAVHPAPRSHERLEAVEAALMGGLPENAAVTLLRNTLKGADPDMLRRAEPLLPAITARLYGIPMAIEQFGGYLRANQDSVRLDRRFVDENALLNFNSGNPEQSLLHITREHLLLTDAPSVGLLRVVAWAGVPVPRSGMVEISKVFGVAGAPLICLSESKLLELIEPVPGAASIYVMHPLVREALSVYYQQSRTDSGSTYG